MKHIQVNGKPLCRSESPAYITALGGPKEANLCKCRYHADSDAVAGAAELQKSLDPEQFSVAVVDGPCENPLYVCAGISDAGTH